MSGALRKKMPENKENEETVNHIKVCTFQLQTKSFWISLVTILILFLLSIVWLNTYYWHNTCIKLIEMQQKVNNK